MSYQKIKFMELKEIIRRKADGQSISKIAREMQKDRKTIRKYLAALQGQQPIELLPDIAGNTENQTKSLCLIVDSGKKKVVKQEVFAHYTDEIEKLLSGSKNSLKIKSAYEVICKMYGLSGTSSLSSFKRFIKANNIQRANGKTTCRIERRPGEDCQIDYAKMGKVFDPVTKRTRSVYAFIGSLPYSRHKFVEYVFSQNQRSFVESHVKMFIFFQGVPKVLTIDNLKTGVIKPDLYNPQLNKTYAEMAAHYGCFVNAARVARPKDKPTVERDVQTIREEFLKCQALDPTITLTEANRHIRKWLVEEYGARKHGTTQEYPYEVFQTIEHPCLLLMPVDWFEVAEWKQAKVHPDCFIQVNKKAYSVPYRYTGETLTVKVKSKTIEIYYQEELIKVHMIPKNHRQTDYDDFPENVQKAIDTRLPLYLQEQAEQLSGQALRSLIRKMLTPHAYINLRRAQGILSVAKKYDRSFLEEASRLALNALPGLHPKEFEMIIIGLINLKDEEQQDIMTTSEQTKSFSRSSEYYDNHIN